MPSPEDLQKIANKLRINCIKAIHKAGSGHTGGALSAMDIMVALYYGDIDEEPVMKFDPNKPGWEDQDYFVLSKAHAAPALYSILADRSFFDVSELDYLRQVNSMLQANPSMKIPGVAITTGFPGHGFAAANGLAMALKLDKNKRKVFTLLGDGELQSGLVWETALAAAQHKSDNLIAFVDSNELQKDNFTRGILEVESIIDKFEAFGWKTVPVKNGHDYEEILLAIEKAFYTTRKPTCIVCKTVKGKGVKFAERNVSYHNAPLSEQELNEAIPNLEK